MSVNKNERITLCYSPYPFLRSWTCEYGYESIEKADERTFEIIKKDNNLITTLFPTNQYVPQFFHQYRIQWRLMKLHYPHIRMINKR
jgi:hypothetical protein